MRPLCRRLALLLVALALAAGTAVADRAPLGAVGIYSGQCYQSQPGALCFCGVTHTWPNCDYNSECDGQGLCLF